MLKALKTLVRDARPSNWNEVDETYLENSLRAVQAWLLANKAIQEARA